ncbi:uncharacterized protein LOC129940069 [Eupeodes corollae]|uniref:uncharacterized protein LOC129940069 n=1 Tax=Eupeodes corollae TaxID=290404 RepID=UPI00248FFB6C|nr:uncharacterized protein LOC129940069 [Eupeodes corollae]
MSVDLSLVLVVGTCGRVQAFFQIKSANQKIEMPRKPVSNRKKGFHTRDEMKQALLNIDAGMSIRKAAKECKLSYHTVRRYFLKSKNSDPLSDIRLTPNYQHLMIFTEEQETSLKQYIDYCASIFYGITAKDCRKLAFQLANINEVENIPENWKTFSMAGIDWLRGFRTRHPDLSLRKPEACSLARATSFNKKSVDTFFDNLFIVMQRQTKFSDGTRIFNLDETATTTVQKPQKVLAPKNSKNLSKVTSGERGVLVTTSCIVSASGQALPPVIVFPRKNYKSYMLHGAPTGSLDLATSSGWMNSELFVDVMKHFIKNTNSSITNPSLLIMDNHESHLAIEAHDLAKASGVTILTFHPHTTSKMQPLDVGVFGPFKKF